MLHDCLCNKTLKAQNHSGKFVIPNPVIQTQNKNLPKFYKWSGNVSLTLFSDNWHPNVNCQKMNISKFTR